MTTAGRTGLPKTDPIAFRKAGPGAFISSWKNLFWVLVAVVALTYGWRVTQVDFVNLVVNLPRAERIVSGLLRPDILAQATEQTTVTTPLPIGAAAGAEPSSAAVGSGRLVVTPGAVTPAAPLTVAVNGVEPDSEVTFWLVDPSNNARPIRRNERTDTQGNASVTFTLPDSLAPGAYGVRADLSVALGRWQLTDTFVLSAQKMVETIFLALMGTFFAMLVSIPLSFLGARNLMLGSRVGWLVYSFVRTIFNVLRSIETLILAVIMAVVVGLGPFAGVMAIVIHSIGAMGKLYSEAIESIDPGPIEAITATGANRVQVILFAVVPQVVPQFLSFTMYRWDINVRLSTVIGLVGGGGIGFLLIQYINLLQWNQAGAALWMIGAIVILMDYASATIRARLV